MAKTDDRLAGCIVPPFGVFPYFDVGNLPTSLKFFTHAADGVMANLQRLPDLPVAFLRRVFQLFGDDRFAGRSLPSLPVVVFNW